MNAPRFITIEGIDGSGKTTLAREIAMRLASDGHAVRLTYEPGGTQLGRSIRKLLLQTSQDQHEIALPEDLAVLDTESAWFRDKPEPLAELLLFAAARAQHVKKIREWLRGGEYVICDRYADSTYAYQGARGINKNTIDMVERIAAEDLGPGITFLLDVPVDEAQSRLFWARKSAMDRFDRETRTYMERVRRNYLSLAKRHAKRITVLDATQPLDHLTDQAMQLIATAIEEREDDMTMRVGRPATKADKIVEVFGEWLEEFKQGKRSAIMPSDLAKDPRVNAGTTTVRRTLHRKDLWTDELRDAMAVERYRRVNESKRINAEAGRGSLQRQAAAGYPNLVKAREVRAAKAAQAQAARQEHAVEAHGARKTKKRNERTAMALEERHQLAASHA